MPETDVIWMTLLVFVPTLFALGLLFFPRGSDKAMCWWTLSGTAITLGISIAIFIQFKLGVIDYNNAATNPTKENRAKISLDERTRDADRLGGGSMPDDYVARYDWIKRFNIEYFLGVDGISLPLIILTAFLSFLAMIASFNIKRYESSERFVKGYCMLFLVLETGMLGTFVALDFFLFYIFWEVMLLPMYFLIGIWGGPRREYAAIKFFLYTLLGSIFILIALLGFYYTDIRDFVNPQLVKQKVDELRLADGKLSPQEAFDKAVVNSFDIIALTRAGRAALQYLNSPDKAQLKVAQEHLAKLKSAETPDEKAIKEAEERVKEAEDKAANAVTVREITRYLKDQEELLKEAKKHLEKLKEEKKPDPDAIKDAEERVKKAEDKVKEAKTWDGYLAKGFPGRLEQWFFRPQFQILMFLFLFIGFAIKVPMFPFHTWLPDAHVEAPTPISMILAGVLLKLGGYGILRIAYPICPYAAETLAAWVALFGVISIVYGAFAAMAQTDFKKLVAYSSVSHMGYVVLGIAVWSTAENSNAWSFAMNGAMFQMIAHGITSAGMFFLVGVIYDRAHHRNLDNFRGLYDPMPLYGGLSAVIFFAAMGLPGLCGFIGEVMVVLGTWKFAPDGMQWVGITFAVLSALTVVLTAAYILWTLQRVFMGTNPLYKNYPDITVSELAVAIPLVVLAVALGVLPGLLLLNWMEPSVTNLVDTLVSYKP